uniref:ATP synthase membrane subunit c locus 3a n=1 Tax=Erpetoichthys calabaricus TaxID=27687 RepID=A0A8C4S3J8_ERPCA
MYACAKFVSFLAMVCTGSLSLFRSISATVLSQLEVRTGEGKLALVSGTQSPFSQIALREFQTSAGSQDIDTAVKFIGAGAATVGVSPLWHFLYCIV